MDKAPRTVNCYVAHLRLLADHFKTDLHQISEEKIRQYFLFPGVGRRWKRNLRGKPMAQKEAQRLAMNEATAPMRTSTVQNTLKLAVVSLHFKKRITPHTLRHCYATHLLDKGVNLRHISSYLGHASLNETLVYLHLSSIGEEQTHAILKDIHHEVIAPKKQPPTN
jgi:integrase